MIAQGRLLQHFKIALMVRLINCGFVQRAINKANNSLKGRSD